jgi:hypothetical protein
MKPLRVLILYVLPKGLTPGSLIVAAGVGQISGCAAYLKKWKHGFICQEQHWYALLRTGRCCRKDATSGICMRSSSSSSSILLYIKGDDV